MLSIDFCSLEKPIRALRVWLTLKFPCFLPVYSFMKISYIHLAPTTHCQGYLLCMRALDSTFPPLSQLLERANSNV